MTDAPGSPLLDVRDLTVEFATRRGLVRAVQNIDISLAKGETLGIVGESGSGKSVTSYAVKRGLRLSVGSWNTIWIWLRSGSRAKAFGMMPPISSPLKAMRPEVWSSRRITIIEVVDLPQPDSPTRPTLSP